MLSDDVCRRLSQLVSRPANEATRLATHWAADARAARAPTPTGGWLAGALEWEGAGGKHLRLQRPLTEISASEPSAEPPAHAPLQQRPGSQVHAELAALAERFPREALFLDLETCGFAGAPVFLVGLVWYCQGRLVLDQLFARDFSEERAILDTLWRVVAGRRVLVTYNGKSFDWPMVHDRSTRHLLGRGGDADLAPESAKLAATSLGWRNPRTQLVHCDLLHHARRRWKGVLPNCRLQTLERYVCRRWRRDDVGGAEVPAAYFEYVRTGATSKVEAILQHNALDLLTLVELARRLLSPRQAAA